VEFITQENRTQKDIEEGQVFVGGFISPEHLRMARELKALFVTFTGPNFLPLKELADRGVIVSNTHGNAQSVAEKAIALTLSF
jgi:phosphoglycerate dehydrogenase-like enzyme